MDNKKQEYNPKFTPAVAIKTSSPFINKTTCTGNIVKNDEKHTSDGDECELYEDFKNLVNDYNKLAERFIGKDRTILVEATELNN